MVSYLVTAYITNHIINKVILTLTNLVKLVIEVKRLVKANN